MERHFTLPVVFSAAVHGALLFGVPGNPRVVAPDDPVTTDVIRYLIPMPMPEPPDAIELTSDEAPAEAKENAIVSSLEPPPMDIGARPTMPLPPVRPIGPKIETSVIPTNWSNHGDGTGESEFTRKIVSAGLLDQPPRTRFQASPLYPFEARASGTHGEVIVDFLVDEDGRVRDPKVVRSSHRMFEEPSLRAIVKWQFEPGRRDGRIVRFRMTVPVQFSLN